MIHNHDSIWCEDPMNCAICMVEICCIGLMPCGHTTCANCAPSLRECPFCRSPIDATNYFYLASSDKGYNTRMARGNKSLKVVDDLDEDTDMSVEELFEEWRHISCYYLLIIFASCLKSLNYSFLQYFFCLDPKICNKWKKAFPFVKISGKKLSHFQGLISRGSLK